MDPILADCADFTKIRPESVYPPLGLVPTRYNHEELRTNVPRCHGRFVLIVVDALIQQQPKPRSLVLVDEFQVSWFVMPTLTLSSL